MIVATGGCFDLLHVGHIDFLAKCARLCGPDDELIVFLNDDASVERLKGDGRPILQCVIREAALMALPFVDGVIVFSEDTPYEMLKVHRADIWCKSVGHENINELPETSLIHSYGGMVISIASIYPRISTTFIIEQINKLEQANG